MCVDRVFGRFDADWDPSSKNLHKFVKSTNEYLSRKIGKSSAKVKLFEIFENSSLQDLKRYFMLFCLQISLKIMLKVLGRISAALPKLSEIFIDRIFGIFRKEDLDVNHGK